MSTSATTTTGANGLRARLGAVNTEAFRLHNAGVVYALFVLVVTLVIATAVTGRPPYLSAINTANVFDQATQVGILAVFMTIVLISGNLPFKTEVAAVFVFNHIQSGDQNGASAVAVVMLVIAFVLLLAIGGLRYLTTRHERNA